MHKYDFWLDYVSKGRPIVAVRGYRVERVFRVEDTDGGPLPERPGLGHLTGDSPQEAWAAVAHLVSAAGYALTSEPETGGARGHTDYQRRLVNVDPRWPQAEQVAIGLHELGHIQCGHEHRRDIPRGQRETEAESVAYIVGTVLGLDPDSRDRSAVYVGGWSDGPEQLQGAQKAIHEAARAILSTLETRAQQHQSAATSPVISG